MSDALCICLQRKFAPVVWRAQQRCVTREGVSGPGGGNGGKAPNGSGTTGVLLRQLPGAQNHASSSHMSFIVRSVPSSELAIFLVHLLLFY